MTTTFLHNRRATSPAAEVEEGTAGPRACL